MTVSINGIGTIAGVPQVAGGPCFIAVRNTGGNFAGGAYLVCPWDVEEMDSHGCYDSGGTFRFTPNVAGWYWLAGQAVTTVTAGNSEYALALFKNGVMARRIGYGWSSGATAPWPSGGSLLYLNGTTDYADLRLYTTGAVTIQNFNTNSENRFEGFLVRAA